MSLLAHYKLNGDANDASGNGLHGTASGGSYVAGKVGLAWNNGGNSRVLVPYSSPLYPGNAMTFAVWMNLATTTFSPSPYHFAQLDYLSNKMQWGVYQDSGTGKSLKVFTSPTGGAFGGGYASFGVALSTGWTHVAVTANNTTKEWKLYINGSLAASVTAYSTYSNVGSHLTLGGVSSGQYSNGIFDDARFYGKILEAWQIQSLYNFGKGSEECEPWQRLIRPMVQRIVQPLMGAA